MSIDIRLFRLRNCFLNKGKQESDQIHNKHIHLCNSSAKIERIILLKTKDQNFQWANFYLESSKHFILSEDKLERNSFIRQSYR